MHTTLITGVNGFVGHHLAKIMKEAGCTVWGNGRDNRPGPEIANLIDHYIPGDLTDPLVVAKLPIEKLDSIINLAGLANVGASFDNPKIYQKVNVDVIKNIGRYLQNSKGTHVRLLAISTGAVYDPTQPPPFTENSTLIDQSSTSPYVASKLAMELAAADLQDKGLDVIVMRPLNHIGPGQKGGFLLPDLAEQIKTAATHNKKTIRVGNLSNLRDFTDVRDVARAYCQVALSDNIHHKIYNVCSGKPLSGLQILNLLSAQLNKPNLKVEIDQGKIRPSDPAVLYGDHSALTEDTGWRPTITIQQTVEDFVRSL